MVSISIFLRLFLRIPLIPECLPMWKQNYISIVDVHSKKSKTKGERTVTSQWRSDTSRLSLETKWELPSRWSMGATKVWFGAGWGATTHWSHAADQDLKWLSPSSRLWLVSKELHHQQRLLFGLFLSRSFWFPGTWGVSLFRPVWSQTQRNPPVLPPEWRLD